MIYAVVATILIFVFLGIIGWIALMVADVICRPEIDEGSAGDIE